MVTDNLLAQLNQKDIKHFLKDINQFMRVQYQLEKEYARGQADVTDLIKKYKELIGMANKKYPGIFLKLRRTADSFLLQIFFKKEKNIKDVFTNAASKINGLKAIGTKNLGEADVTNADIFNKKFETVKDIIYISYQTAEFGAQTLILEYNKKQKMVELRYEPENIQNENEPDFKILAYYALIFGYNDKIDIYKKGSQIVMTDLLYYNERKEYLERFDPRFLE